MSALFSLGFVSLGAQEIWAMGLFWIILRYVVDGGEIENIMRLGTGSI